jgi:CRISPR-associated protein (TIGR02584 family)
MTSRRVLFATMGATPQILAETLWALAQDGWTPDEAHVVTTARGRDALSEARRDGGELCPPRTPDHFEIVVPATESGEVDDILTADAAEAMANAVLRTLAGLARDPNTELHVSIAGGRKTMSADAALAASLVCRPQDRVSHVLVSPLAYEANRSFWRPDQTSPCVDHFGKPLDPKAAHVRLVEVPTPRLRYSIGDPDALARLDFRQVVDEINAARGAGGIVLNVFANALDYAGRRVELSPVHFALYRWLAAARIENWRGAGPAGAGPEHRGWISYEAICEGGAPFPPLIEVYIRFIEEALGGATQADRSVEAVRTCFAKREPDASWRALRARDADPIALFKRHIRPELSRLRRALVNGFGQILAARVCPVHPKVRGEALRFGLAFAAEEISIQEN